MSDKWYPVIHLDGGEGVELAEEYKDVDADDTRVVVVEVEDGSDEYEAYIERRFGDADGGYQAIGSETHPGEDLAQPMIEAAKDLGDGVRLVFDYTNDAFHLEEWVEPE